MKTWFGPLPALLAAAALVAVPGCGGTTNNATASVSGTGTDSTTASSTDTATASGSDSDSASASETDGTGSASMTSLPTTGDPPPTSTTDPDTTSTSMPVSTTDSSTTATSTTEPDTTSTATTDSSSTTGPDCTPTEEVCNDLDDDCNGIIDDVDVGGDGICDCLNIAIFGNEGANPSAEFQAWLEAQGTQVDRISLDITPITQETIAPYDIIILDWLVRTYSQEEAAVIEGWVGDGGGLMSMTGHTNNNTVVERPNSIIAPMGLSYNASQGFFSGPVTQWTPHQITEGITSVSFYGGLYVDIVEDGVGSNEVIGMLPQGPVAVAQVRKDGKLFIFGDEWIEFDSEWQQIPQIKQFWVNILGWLSPQNFCTIPQ